MPAAAVIPAPIAYAKVVAVKKLVVETLERPDGPEHSARRQEPHLLLERPRSARPGCTPSILYCEEMRVFKAGNRLEYVSME